MTTRGHVIRSAWSGHPNDDGQLAPLHDGHPRTLTRHGSFFTWCPRRPCLAPGCLDAPCSPQRGRPVEPRLAELGQAHLTHTGAIVVVHVRARMILHGQILYAGTREVQPYSGSLYLLTGPLWTPLLPPTDLSIDEVPV